MQNQKPFRIGPIRFIPDQLRIEKAGKLDAIEPRLMQALLVLADHAPQTVSKEKFMEEVWPNVSVSESSVTKVISQLRGLFEDDANDPKFIETIHKRGYRLLVEPQFDLLKTKQLQFLIAGVIVLAITAVFFISGLANEKPKVAKSIQTTGREVLTSFKGRETSPCFSPNGERIVFISEPYDRSLRQVMIHDMTTKETYVPFSEAGHYQLVCWVGSSNLLLISEYAEGEHRLFTYDLERQIRTEILNLGSEFLVNIASNPRTGRIVLSKAIAKGEPYGLYFLNLVNKQLSPIILPQAGELGYSHPQFDPSGKKIVFLHVYSPSRTQVEWMNLETGEKGVLNDAAGIYYSVDWLDTNNLLAVGNSHQGQQLYLSPDPYKKWEHILEFSDFRPMLTDASPAGFVFENWKSHRNIYIYKPGEGAWHEEISSDYNEFGPDLHGSKVLFGSLRTGSKQVFLYEGGSTKQITFESNGEVRSPRWSEDGSQIYYILRSTDEHQLKSIALNGDQPRVLASFPQIHFISYEANGEIVVSAESEEGLGVFKVSPDGSTQFWIPGGFKVVKREDRIWLTKSGQYGLFEKIGSDLVFVDQTDDAVSAGWDIYGKDCYFFTPYLELIHLDLETGQKTSILQDQSELWTGNLSIHPQTGNVWFDAELRAESDLVYMSIQIQP